MLVILYSVVTRLGICLACDREDICALKRLQRDAFEQLLRISERLDAVEQDSDASGTGAAAGASVLGGSARRNRAAAGTSGRSQVQVSGQLVYGREYVSLEVSLANQVKAVEQTLASFGTTQS